MSIGQYFTKNKDLQDHVIKFVMNSPTRILEPSVGRGDLVKCFPESIKFDMYEIDKNIDFIIDKNSIIFEDFLKANISDKYKTIIGNPPYVKTKKGNLYIDFISKCFNLLDENGELVFIVPSDFFKLTTASTLLKRMMDAGTFTHIYHPNNERLFDNANIDVIIFRYCKSPQLNRTVLYNNVAKVINNSNGLITFDDSENESKSKISDMFDIYVGLVNGKEEVFKNEIGNIDVLSDYNKINKYIYIDKFPSGMAKIDEHLLANKDILLERKIRKFNDKNWFEWGAPRNIEIMKKFVGENCIYVRTLTRNKVIAFAGKVGYFGGGLLMMIPKKIIDISAMVDYLNSDKFKNNFIYSGRFKIGHKQLSDSPYI